MSLALGFARSEDDPSRGRELLDFSLRDDIESKTGRKKTVTVLTRSWLIPDPEAEAVVEWGVEHAGGDLRPGHLGVLFANYAFFVDACAAIGRQLSLGSSVSTRELRTTLKHRWGDREVIDVASRGVIRTLISFGVLSPTDDDSISEPGKPIVIDGEVYPWLIHAVLVGRGEMETDIRSVTGTPEFFMFDLPPTVSRDYPNLEHFTEGGGRVVVRRRSMPRVTIDPVRQLLMNLDGLPD